MKRSIKTIATILLMSSISWADMLPKRSEVLKHPIETRCGTIYEWHGSQSIKEFKRVCKLVLINFNRFQEMQGLEGKYDGRFSWSIALLRDGRCFRRCINDLRYRFSDRATGAEILSGYTSFTNEIIFIGEIQFSVSLAHELYHALNYYYYGIEDEGRATEFTEWLGLGR